MRDVPIGVLLGFCSATLTAVITEVYAHRGLAHRAFRVQPRFAKLLDGYFRVIVWTDPESWAAVHRLHHRYADTPRDPHSPLQRPPAAILLGSPYLFALARRDLPPGTDSPPTRTIVVLRLAVPFAWFLVLGLKQVLLMTVVHLVFYLGIMGLVNTVGHIYGRKPHPDVVGYDAAWLAIPLLGHGYHNSHHAHPAAARTGRLDSIWPILRLLAAVRLVELGERPVHRASGACCQAKASLAGRT